MKRTALYRSSVARVIDATRGGGSSDEGGHGSNGEESELGEHFKEWLVVVGLGKLVY